jgi:ABC-type spermidine/putrescine transport system permease subunit II
MELFVKVLICYCAVCLLGVAMLAIALVINDFIKGHFKEGKK